MDENLPGKDKIFAAVFPHSDDFSISVGGLIIKLLSEGMTGYFIRTSNDEMDSYDLTAGETMFRIEQETRAVAEFFGIRHVYDFNYKNHYLDHALVTEMHQTPIDNMWKERIAANKYPRFEDKKEFIRKTMLESQPAMEGLRYYEKYRHIAEYAGSMGRKMVKQ